MRRLLALAAAVGLACAEAPGSAWLASHPGFVRHAPEADAELGAMLASLEQPEPPVSVASLRLLDPASDPPLPVMTSVEMVAGELKTV